MMKQLAQRLAVVTLSGVLLAACGGGGGSSPPAMPGPTEAVPPEASESSAGLVKYLLDLAAASADDKEPLDLSGFAPKKPEDGEPEPLGT